MREEIGQFKIFGEKDRDYRHERNEGIRGLRINWPDVRKIVATFFGVAVGLGCLWYGIEKLKSGKINIPADTPKSLTQKNYLVADSIFNKIFGLSSDDREFKANVNKRTMDNISSKLENVDNCVPELTVRFIQHILHSRLEGDVDEYDIHLTKLGWREIEKDGNVYFDYFVPEREKRPYFRYYPDLKTLEVLVDKNEFCRVAKDIEEISGSKIKVVLPKSVNSKSKR